MIEHPHTDKVRIVDLGVADDPDAFVHSIEVSDDRSVAHFITAYTCGKTPAVLEMAARLPVSASEHDPAIYHRDDEGAFWVQRHFRRSLRKGWTNHYHWPLDEPPSAADVEAVFSDLGRGARTELMHETLAAIGAN